MGNGIRTIAMSLLLDLVLAFGVSGNQVKRVFIVNFDGTPYHVCDSDTTPFLWDSLATTYGTWFSNLWQTAYTVTGGGHAQIMSGNENFWTNDTNQTHYYPSLGECLLKELLLNDTTKAVVFSGKSHSQARWWGRSKHPSDTLSGGLSARVRYVGVGGIDSRSDSLWRYAMHPYLTTNAPRYVYVDWHDTDTRAHLNGRIGLNAAAGLSDLTLKDSLMCFIRNTDPYKDSTALLVITDHGRHSWTNVGGDTLFPAADDSGHGDACTGCRHVWAALWGPGVRAGYTDSLRRQNIEVVRYLSQLLGLRSPYLRFAPLRYSAADSTPLTPASSAVPTAWYGGANSGGAQLSDSAGCHDPDVAHSGKTTHWVWTEYGNRRVRYKNSNGTTATLALISTMADTNFVRWPRIAARGDTVIACFSFYRKSGVTANMWSWWTVFKSSTDAGVSWSDTAALEDSATICSDLAVGVENGNPFALAVLVGTFNGRHPDYDIWDDVSHYIGPTVVWVKRSTDLLTWTNVFRGSPASLNCVLGRGVELAGSGKDWVVTLPASIGSVGASGAGTNDLRQNVESVMCRSAHWGKDGTWERFGGWVTDHSTVGAAQIYENALQPSTVLIR